MHRMNINGTCAGTLRSNAVGKTVGSRLRLQPWAVMTSTRDNPIGAPRSACVQADTLAWSLRREKVTGLEAKLRAALQDKNSAQVEKATAERNLKALQGQAGRLTKDLEKKARE